MKLNKNQPYTAIDSHRKSAHVRSILFGIVHLTPLALFCITLVSYVTFQILTRSLLDPNIYTRVFAKNRLYERVYDEVLADPDIQNRVNKRLDKFGISPATSEVISSYAVSTLYLVLPPPQLKQAVDEIVVEITEYLKGHRDRIDSEVGIKSIIADEHFQNRLLTTLQTRVAEQAIITDLFADVSIAVEAQLGSGDPDDFETILTELHDFSYGLTNSKLEGIPVGLFTLQTDQLTEEQQDAILDAFFSPLGEAVKPETVAQVRAALNQQDMSSAITLASRELARPVVQKIIEDVLNDLDDDNLDLLTLYASVMDNTQQDIFARINSARTFIQLIRQVFYPMTIVLMGISLGILALTNVKFLLKIREIGLTLILAGAIILLGWVILPINAQFVDVLESNVLEIPVPIQELMHDIINGIIGEIRLSIILPALYLLVAGLVLLVLGYNQQFWRWLLRTQITPEQMSHRAVGAVFLLTVLPVLVVEVLSNRTETPILRCNGSIALCDRRLNDVTFAASHNAMSISSQGWIFPSHDGTLTDQLDAGIRAFMLDVHYFNTGDELRHLAMDGPPETQAAILEIIDELNLDRELQRDGTWLCHGVCLLGSTQFVDALVEIRIFMQSHPNEVVLLLLQDVVDNTDIAQAFAESGLEEYVYRGSLTGEMPTLAELIALDQRIMVMAEEAGPPPDWYHYLWDWAEETPYKVSRIEEFSCEPYRGGTERMFFLLNHWITKISPSRVDAIRVNNYDVLLGRARTCAEERGKIPNIIAVNFYNLSDVVAVVDAINAGALD